MGLQERIRGRSRPCHPPEDFLMGFRPTASLISAVSHPSPLSLGLPLFPSLPIYPPGLPSAAKACLPCPLPSSRSGHPASGTGAGCDRASLARSAPIKHRKPPGFSGHQSILLTIVSFKANASILRLDIYYTIYPALYDIVISILMKHEGECFTLL